MTIPLLVLLGFAAWTLITLFTTVGVYRWSRILTKRAAIADFVVDEPHEEEWYRRAMRSHANCLENLPVYTAITVVIVTTGIQSSVIDGLAITLLIARVLQTITHVAFKQTNTVVGFRFAFFLTQVICMLGMGITVALQARSPRITAVSAFLPKILIFASILGN